MIKLKSTNGGTKEKKLNKEQNLIENTGREKKRKTNWKKLFRYYSVEHSPENY